MANRVESREENKELQSALLRTAASVLQIHQRVDQEILRRNEALKNRTEELAQALVIMRATLESTTDAILVINEEGNVTDFNDKYLDMWKIPREMLQGSTARVLREFASRNFADPQQFSDRIAEITAGTQESFDLLELKDGRSFERYSKIISIEGRRLGRVWTFRDVTQRHLAEITSARLAAIVTSSDDGIIGKNLDSIVTSWNFGAQRIFGYTADEMIGTSIMRLIPPERSAEERDILDRISRGERLDHFETIRRAKDGRLINVSIAVSPIKDSAGHVVGASKVVRDITDQKRAEAALKKAMEDVEAANRERLRLLDSERGARFEAERASSMKDEFLATLSHELRTPLNAVLGWAQILRTGKLQADELRQGLDTIERNARAQAQIIEDLLDMSRIISGKLRLIVEQVDLPIVINESINTVRAAAEAKGIRVKVIMDPRAGTISGDPNRLQQVFWNLLNNAIKFTPTGGKVDVSLERLDLQIEVRVIDNGEGIAPEFLPYVFDRFQQGDATITRRHGGLGLGLAIVKQLIELHGGNIWVSSDGIGKGTTFTVHLPLIAARSDPEKALFACRKIPEADQPLQGISLGGVHVMVVDDEADAREFVKKLLEIAGATVSLAGSASEAVQGVLVARPDVLICDIGMPAEDGYSLIRQLRVLEEQHGTPALPAVALTAYARSQDRTKVIRSGFQNHLAKPVEPAELLAVVSSLAGHRVATPPDAD